MEAARGAEPEAEPEPEPGVAEEGVPRPGSAPGAAEPVSGPAERRAVGGSGSVAEASGADAGDGAESDDEPLFESAPQGEGQRPLPPDQPAIQCEPEPEPLGAEARRDNGDEPPALPE
eukprot:COSAG04_NODE_7696_length_1085_cov_6.925963_2_plen_117_part_01